MSIELMKELIAHHQRMIDIGQRQLRAFSGERPTSKRREARSPDYGFIPTWLIKDKGWDVLMEREGDR